MRRIMWLMGPAILGNAAVQINVTVNNNLASRLGDGPVSWLGYASASCNCLLVYLALRSLRRRCLPSPQHAKQDFNEFRSVLSRSLVWCFLLTVPSAVGLAVLGDSIVGAIYEMGKFTALDTRQTACSLLLRNWIGRVCGGKGAEPGLLCLGRFTHTDAREPVFNRNQPGGGDLDDLHRGNGACEPGAIDVRSRDFQLTHFVPGDAPAPGRHLPDAIWRTFYQVAIASAAMGAVVWLSSRMVIEWLGTTKLARLTDLLISIPLGLFVLYVGCRVLRIPEFDAAARALAGPLQKKTAIPAC